MDLLSKTIENVWECECDTNFLHFSEYCNQCDECGAYREDSPDAQLDVVLEHIPSLFEFYSPSPEIELVKEVSEVVKEYGEQQRAEMEMDLRCKSFTHNEL